MAPPPLRTPLVVSAIVLFALTRAYILFAFQPQASDLSVYFGNAVLVADLGKTPYSRDLLIEFPPLAWWTMAAAREMSGVGVSESSSPDQVTTARLAYARAFRRLMAVADGLAFGFFIAIVRRWRPEIVGPSALVYAIASAMLAHVLYDRLDAGLLLLILAALYCWTRSTDSTTPGNWRRMAYFVLGLGVAFKVIPVLLLPFFLVAELRRADRLQAIGVAAISVVAGLALPFGIQFLISGAGVFDLVSFHSGRGVQLESFLATIMASARAVGYPVQLELWEGGVNLTGSLAPVLLAASNIILAGALAVLAYWSFREADGADRRVVLCAGCLAIAGSVILSKVFSPQYLIWAVPLLLLASNELCRSARSWWTIAAALMLVAALTAWLFPHNYFNFKAGPFSLEPTAVAPARLTMSFVVVGIRNAVYLTVVIALAVRLLRARGSPGIARKAPNFPPSRKTAAGGRRSRRAQC
jgi:4-amino-4-deoxy-L-arabinose transferase-like glycosyltransferase